MNVSRKAIAILSRAVSALPGFVRDAIASYLFRSSGLPTIFYCAALALALYAALIA